MPTVAVKRQLLFAALGRSYTDEQFADLCFDYGLELDEVTTVEACLVQRNADDTESAQQELTLTDADNVVYKVDVPANRYDLLCLEGLARALLIFQGRASLPDYQLASGDSDVSPCPYTAPSTASSHRVCISVTAATRQVRPYLVAAVLRDLTFTPAVYDSFIELQDKLHHNIGRRRQLVAIGTHDLDTLQAPFCYDARPPADIRFRALSQTRQYTAVELMQLYSADSHLKPYLGIIRDSAVYPVIEDRRRVVLSMPPIINGHHSRITVATRNVLIECTATDLNKAQVVLDTIVCMFSGYCRRPFHCEPVEVRYESAPGHGVSIGRRQIYPRLEYRQFEVSVRAVAAYIGVPAGGGGDDGGLTADKMCDLLTRMSLQCRRPRDDNTSTLSEDRVLVRVPPTRHDILHVCDIIEDVAIAYGYNKIVKRLPEFGSVAVQNPLNQLCDQLRQQVAQAGFTEALTFSLCARDDIGAKMRGDCSQLPVVHIANPKALEFQVVRTALLPGLLKTAACNRKQPLPLRLFELSDVVLVDAGAETGASNQRHLAALHCGRMAGFEVIHGLLDRLMQLLEVPRAASAAAAPERRGYWLRPVGEDAAFLSGRCADVLVDGRCVGRLGVLHPEVVTNFELTLACSALELNIEPFV